MIRIFSIEQAISLQGNIPELAVIRSIQFMGDGYNPEEHGHIMVFQEGDTVSSIHEIGEFIDWEYVEAFIDRDRLVFEVVFQIDDSRTIAVIIPDEPWLDDHLRSLLKQASLTPMPLPRLKEVTT